MKDVVEICNSASWLFAVQTEEFLKKEKKKKIQTLCDLPGPCSVLTFSFYVYLIETITFLLKSESDRGTFNVNQQLIVFYISFTGNLESKQTNLEGQHQNIANVDISFFVLFYFYISKNM